MFNAILPASVRRYFGSEVLEKASIAPSKQREVPSIPDHRTCSRSSSPSTLSWSSNAQSKSPSIFPPQPKLPEKIGTVEAVSVSAPQYAESIRLCKEKLRQDLHDEDTIADLTAFLSDLIARSAEPPFDALVLRAMAHYIAEDWPRCVQDCEEVLALDPENRFAIVYRAVVCHTQHTPTFAASQEAYDKVRAWAAAHPDDRFANIVSCVFPVTAADYQEAETTLQRLLQKEPNDLCALSMLMAIYNAWPIRIADVDAERLEQKALACAERILQLDPHDDSSKLIIEWHREGVPATLGQRILITRPTIAIKYPIQNQDLALASLFS